MLFLVFFGLLLGSSFLVLFGLQTLRSASQNLEAGNWSQREHHGPILALSSSAWCCSACMELEHTSRQMSLILICLWRLKQIRHPKDIISKDTLYFFPLRLSPKYDSLVILKFKDLWLVYVVALPKLFTWLSTRYCSPARLWNSQPGAGV